MENEKYLIGMVDGSVSIKNDIMYVQIVEAVGFVNMVDKNTNVKSAIYI